MADGIDTSIALKTQTPDMLGTIGNMLNIADKATSVQKHRATLDADILKAQAESQSAQTKSALDKWKFTSDQAQKAYEISASLITDPAIVKGDSEGSVKALMGAEDQMRAHGIPENQIRVQMGPMYALAGHNPQGLQQVLKNVLKGEMSAGGQANAIQPTGPVLNTGQTQQPMNLNPLAGPTGPVGPGVQNLPPPTTPTFDPKTNTPGILGASKQPGFIPTGPNLGQKELAEGTAKNINTHWEQINSTANSSALLEGIANNIKSFAKKAVTGTAQDKLAFLSGIGSALHLTNDQKTNTDLMMKNMSMLTQNSPAATDAGRLINQLAQPHATMSEEAIGDAADQIVGQLRMARDAQKLFLPLKAQADSGNAGPYNEVLNKFNKFADPRVWQYESLSEPERKKFMGRLSPDDRKKVITSAKGLEEMGFFK